MKKKLDLGNSIYQSAKFSGLTVRNGRLINERPDGQTGIRQVADLKKAVKRADKIQMMSEAVYLGNIKSEMMEGPEMD